MKKNLKGFTLVEVIVAIAVFSIMTLMLTTMYTAACALTYNTNNMNKKVDNQVEKVDITAKPTADALSATPYDFKIVTPSGTVTIQVDAYEQDKDALAQAKLKSPSAYGIKDKELMDAKDSPNAKYFNLAP